MSEQDCETDELVDMELHCVRCHARLYVPMAQISAVMTSLKRTGAAILICVCGQAQFVRTQRLPTHD